MRYISICLVLLSFVLLTTGCAPRLHSMGATLMEAPLQHRVNPDSVNNVFDVSANGFWGMTDDADNVRSVKAGGGAVSATYRFNQRSAFFFANAAVSAFGGSAKFSCSEDRSGCKKEDLDRQTKDYREWLDSEDGHKKYSFGTLQERVVLGMEINTNVIILGLAEGVQFHQAGGNYESMRETLIEDDLVETLDNEDRRDYANVTMLWLGLYLGHHGEFGNFVVELDLLHGKGGFLDDGWTGSTKYTYTHPTGFYAGVAEGSMLSWSFYAGKTFSF